MLARGIVPPLSVLVGITGQGKTRGKAAVLHIEACDQFVTDAALRQCHLPLVPLPPLVEQAAIVRFLHHADRRIRRYIRAKQKLIKLLEEQKQAIIHRAVTRGLDPSIRLKPSDVEWLGEVPEHWEVWQIGHFSQVGNGSTPSRGNLAYWVGGHYPWLNSAYANQESITVVVSIGPWHRLAN
jgi:hypothetical protein